MTYQHTPFKATPATKILDPGTDEWARTVSASKVPAILGISPHASAYSLWARATGRLEHDPIDPKLEERGHLLEPVLLQYLARQLGEGHRVAGGASYVHPDQDLWAAAPDGLIYEGRRRTPYALAECKTAYQRDDWGAEGTADIPAHYLAQCAWQMYVTGARLVYVPALVDMEFRLYVVRWEDVAEDIPLILEAVHEWMVCVADDRAPAWDGSDATLDAVKRMHPEIDRDAQVAIPHWQVQELREANWHAEDAARELKRLKSQLLDAAGQARLVVDEDTGEQVARRQPNRSGVSLVILKPKPVAAAA